MNKKSSKQNKKADPKSFKKADPKSFKKADSVSDSLEKTEPVSDLDSLKFSEKTFEEVLANKFGTKSLETIKTLSYNISKVGLTVEESCLLSGLDYDKFMKYVDTDPFLKRLLVIKNLEYKKKLMKALNSKMEKGDYRTATWIAEKKFEEEFGKNKKPADDDSVLKDALNFVREHSESDDFINDDANKTTVREKDPDINAQIHKYLK